MDKMKMAHEMALAMAADGNMPNENIVAIVWQYADAMQAEEDKRNKAEAEQKRKEMREMLNAPNTFIEREGQHFDDLYECEVDWRIAPSWAKYWATRNDNTALWCASKPTCTDDCLLSRGPCSPAPSFGYTGNWQDSLRERPE